MPNEVANGEYDNYNDKTLTFDCTYQVRNNFTVSEEKALLDIQVYKENLCISLGITTTFKTITCKYRNCKAAGESPITSEASRNAREAFCSPSAAMTLARASLAASASAAIARCNCTGKRTSLLMSIGMENLRRETVNLNSSVKEINKVLSYEIAAGEAPITSEASRKARDAFCSPSAAITLARASRAASASAAMARCNCTGKRTSLLKNGKQ
uniref:Uncharacterized protein n=1 Tax=Glossina morsitans morsitans TaxID=37546 RepID=A0A1B0FA60_GLOMM